MTLLSVAGLYHYDPTIFDDLHLPPELDKTTLLADILIECAELEILIPDPDLLKESINYWSLAQLPIWQKLYNSTQFEYNPIWNKDGTYTETRNLATSDTETRNLAKSNLQTRNLGSSANTTATRKVSAFNSSAFENADQETMNGSGTDTGTVNDTGSDTGTVTRGGTDTGTVTRRETGNIGVTTTQQMIKEEREVVQFNIYRYITESFKSMYCLGVY